MEQLLIGQLAKTTGIPVATIRYYERRHLLPPPARTAGGYRVYSDESVRRIRFVRRAKGLGFRLGEIEALLAIRNAEGEVCRRTRARAVETISRIERRIQELEGMKQDLVALVRSCESANALSDCPIIGTLEETHAGDD